MKSTASGILRRVALVRINISDGHMASIVRVIVHLRGMLRLLVTANVVSSSASLVTLMMEAMPSSKTSRATRRHIPEDDILQMCYQLLKWFMPVTEMRCPYVWVPSCVHFIIFAQTSFTNWIHVALLLNNILISLNTLKPVRFS
jgi:hypothetical protein